MIGAFFYLNGMRYLAKYIALFIIVLFINNISAQVADTSIHIIRSWKYDLNTGVKKSTNFDTTVFDINRYNPLLKSSFSNLYLGNLGSAAVSNIFVERTRSPFVFGSEYAPYVLNENTYHIYKTKMPFTLASFSYGDSKAKEERLLNLLHTQNINEFTNAGFQIRNIQSAGQYSNQKVFQNTMALFTSYDKKRLKLHIMLARNMIKCDENGGIVDSDFENPNNSSGGFNTYQTYYDTLANSIRDVPNSIYRNHNINFLSEYKLINFGKNLNDSTQNESKTALIIGQYTKYDQHFRRFIVNNFNQDYFGHYYIDGYKTNDSAFYRSFSNKAYFKFKSGNQFITGGIENEFLRYGYKTVPDTIFVSIENNNGGVTIYEKSRIITDKSEKKYNTAVYGDIEINISDLLNLKFLGKYYLFGYEQNMINISGKARLNMPKNFIEIGSSLETRRPDYFYNHYISNFFLWNNNFENTREWETEVLIRNKEKLTGIRLNYTLLGNWFYFDNNALIQQLNEVTSISTAKIFGEFNFWKFKTKNEIALQRTGNENALPLPAIAAFHSLSFNHKLFDNVFQFNIGYDLNIYSKYYAYAYMPVTGVFYTQQIKKTGAYPFVDAFVNCKVKKTLFFFKYEHVTQGMFGKKYYTTLHYPSPARVLRFGITWIFLN